MHLWHNQLIHYLPTGLLLALHRHLCGMRGKGWGRPSRNVRYIWGHSIVQLWGYHRKVLAEMRSRGWKPDPAWDLVQYRGKYLETLPAYSFVMESVREYPEHDGQYLDRCIKLITKKIDNNPSFRGVTLEDRTRWAEFLTEYNSGRGE